MPGTRDAATVRSVNGPLFTAFVRDDHIVSNNYYTYYNKFHSSTYSISVIVVLRRFMHNLTTEKY